MAASGTQYSLQSVRPNHIVAELTCLLGIRAFTKVVFTAALRIIDFRQKGRRFQYIPAYDTLMFLTTCRNMNIGGNITMLLLQGYGMLDNVYHGDTELQESSITLTHTQFRYQLNSVLSNS